jgi:D-psicose/D-tagatose/L-ribulose 3-epimerase
VTSAGPPLPVAALLTSLPLPFGPAARLAADLGFRLADVVALAERPASHLEALADAGLVVSCVALGRGLPAGCALDAADVGLRREAVGHVKRQITDAARLGATHGYLVPGVDAGPEALRRFADSCAHLAEHAAARMVRLCVEAVPGRALPTAAAALAWLDDAGLDRLALLLDVGHALISGEDAAAVVRRAGERLGYVHVDDNDGVSDLHWPLLTGRLTRAHLRALLAALREVGYRAPLSLELSPDAAEPAAALRRGRELLEEVAGDAEAGA